jgi:arsenate reductase
LIRQKDAAFMALGLEGADDDTLIKAMAAHPAIIDRPVVRHDGKAALGRPPEDVLKLF